MRGAPLSLISADRGQGLACTGTVPAFNCWSYCCGGILVPLIFTEANCVNSRRTLQAAAPGLSQLAGRVLQVV